MFWQGGTNFAVNMAYAATRARFRGGAPDDRRIPGAVESTFTLGASAKWTGGWQAAAKLRWLGSAPLVENGAIRSSPSLLVNAGVAYRRRNVEYRVDMFNVFDSNGADVSYFFESRLPDEGTDGVADVHVHPLEPRKLQASVSLFW